MRWTQTLLPTLRDVPKDAEAASHKLALRAGLVRQLASGVYTYLPLGFRVLYKIMNIIREEMNRAGAEELLMPALHPADLWKKTGRYESLGDDKIAFKNRAGHEFVLGPTHEEVVTDLAAGCVKSFRDLPFTLYQIQTKFRDEARPRFGVIRTKEFIMKDAYSFDQDEAGLDKNYQKMADAYRKIFTRCGLTFQIVEADTGMMGGKMSQEFMVVCPYGEDRVARSSKGYLASLEIAERAKPIASCSAAPAELPEVFDTPNLRTIDELKNRFKIDPSGMVKTLIYIADEKPVAVLVTGDSEVNEHKLRKLIGTKNLRQAENKEVEQATGAPVGFAGPVGLRLPIYADWDLEGLSSFVCGANQKDTHLKNAVMGRDFTPSAVGDIRNVKEGDPAKDGSGPLTIATTMEIGHIFKLGTRYTEALSGHFLDEKGQRRTILMGCYGIGVNRILAAAIEEHHDDKGIRWPVAIAPYQFEIITLNQKEEKITLAAEALYKKLQDEGFEVFYDDRDERAGVKFKDADLIGIPLQIVLGERGLAEGKIEIKSRLDGTAAMVGLEEFDPGSWLGRKRA